jgi:hypothetical protein
MNLLGRVDRTIDSLRTKGLLFPYRSNNYGLSSLGVMVAQEIVKQFREEEYNDLKILMIIL